MANTLFCYGTLMFPPIMQRVCGFRGRPVEARVAGFARYALKGRHYPALVAEDDATTIGVIYRGLSAVQMRRLDNYEGPCYQRLEVEAEVKGELRERVWCYVWRANCRQQLTHRPWMPGQFGRPRLRSYLANPG